MNDYEIETLGIRAGIARSQFNEHSEALFLTSSFVFNSAEEAAARFKGETPGPIYSRFTNPTVQMMEARLAALEGAEQCVAFASGMAAILATVMGLLKSGDHIVASRSIFGSTVQLFSTILSRFGIQTTFVSPTKVEEWDAATRPDTRLFFVESPSNPLTEISDIRSLATLAHGKQILLAVDNCFCSPALQKPLLLGADLVIHSATKYLDGQGRVLGGAVLGSKALMEGIYAFLRTAGSTLSAFNAWVILKGLETLCLRMDAHSRSALLLAQWLEEQPQIERVFYPGLPSHPQHDLAVSQQRTGGGIIAFQMKGGQRAAWHLINHVRMLSITANLGDCKTTVTHPATTTHGRLTPEQRDQAGITDGLVRIAVGLESPADIQGDLVLID